MRHSYGIETNRSRVTTLGVTGRIIFALVLLVALSARARAAGDVICVPNIGVDGSCTLTAATITSAIATADIAGGDTILVGPGLYAEAPVIDRQLVLRASSAATEADLGNASVQAIIDGSGAIYTVTVADGVTGVRIEGFEITNPTHAGVDTDAMGIRVQSDNAGGSTVVVDIVDNVIHDTSDPTRTSAEFGELGIGAFNIGGGSTISGNSVFGLADAEPPTAAGESPGRGRAQGILVKSSNGSASGVAVTANTVHDVLDVAIRINGVPGATSADVSGNRIFAVGSPGTGFLSGIGIDHLGLGTVSANQIDSISGGFGLGIQASGTTAVTGNSISGVSGGNGLTFPGSAILINTDGVAVSDNFIAGNAIGITVGSTVASGTLINGNCIEGNASAGVLNGSGSSIDATNNWWGCVGGPGDVGCDVVSDVSTGVTTFAPFSATANCSQCGAARFVATTGSDGGNFCLDSLAPCRTVQHGVDVACEGNTVNVAAGSYDEQVAIAKNLTVSGAGAGATIIEPTSVSANTTSLSTAAAIAAIILAEDASAVTVEGLTVEGASAAFGSCSPGYMGIFYRNASGTVSATHVTDIFHPTAVGCQSVVGILVQSGAGGSSVVAIDGNTIDVYGKNGITCNELGSDCAITNNTVIGRGPLPLGDAAQNGIQIGSGAIGSIVDNGISDNIYIPQTFCATGILVISDGIDVRGNTLDDNFCDLLALTSGSTLSGNNIAAAREFPFSVIGDGNIVDKNQVSGTALTAEGVYVDGINNVFTCNRITNNDTGIFFDTVSTAGTPNSANSNVISGNASAGADATAVIVLPPVDGTGNYWGCASGANTAGCDTALGNIDVTPAAAAEPLCVTCAGAGGDSDDDGVCDPADNCPLVANAGQDDADADFIGDLCDACPLDADNDIDGDSLCADVDNCPSDANLDQSDVDGDAIGDVCDGEDGAGTTVLSRVKLKAARVGVASPRGKVAFTVLLQDDQAGNFLPDDLTLSGDVRFEVAAGPFTAILNVGICVQKNPRLIFCSSGNVKAKFKLLPQGTNIFPNTYKARVKLKRHTDMDSPVGPVTVTLRQPTTSIDRSDDIAACVAKPGRLSCRER